MTESRVSIYFIAVLKKGEVIKETDFADKTKTINYLTQDHFNNIFSESIEKKGRWESMEKERAIKVASFFNECAQYISCLLYTSPSPRDSTSSRMPSSA